MHEDPANRRPDTELTWPYRNALITGASSGIGRALSLALAASGIHVVAAARRREALEDLKSEIASAGGSAEVLTLDVADTSHVYETLRQKDADLGGMDLVIANAGIANGRGAARLSWRECEEVLRVNVLGATATLTALLPRMVRRGQGHLVGISSLASYRALPRLSVYSASKAYLSTLLEGIRIDLQHGPITITDVRAGFVRTPLIDQRTRYARAALSSEEAAQCIVSGIRRRESVVTFPWHLAAVARSTQWMPRRFYQWAMGGKAVRSGSTPSG